jgi:hypothetical protein
MKCASLSRIQKACDRIISFGERNLSVGSDLPVLRTSHLVIRPVEMNDVEACHRLYMDIGWDDKDLTEAQKYLLHEDAS